MSASGYVDGVEVLWRAGCPFCMKLRRGLRRRAIPTIEIDIWKDREAAERIRAVTGGDETVPTVFVGNLALVNPSVKEVVSAVAHELPDRAHEMLAGRRDRRRWWSRMIKPESGRSCQRGDIR